jgi:Protein of unknown function (DUF3892)
VIYITAIQMTPGRSGHEHISHVRWLNGDTGKAATITRAEMVAYIDKPDPHTVQVGGGNGPIKVGVVHPSGGGVAYLRTFANGTWNDNLLEQPRIKET